MGQYLMAEQISAATGIAYVLAGDGTILPAINLITIVAEDAAGDHNFVFVLKGCTDVGSGGSSANKEKNGPAANSSATLNKKTYSGAPTVVNARLRMAFNRRGRYQLQKEFGCEIRPSSVGSGIGLACDCTVADAAINLGHSLNWWE